MERIQLSVREPQILVLCSSKNRTSQLNTVARRFGGLVGVKCKGLIGGKSVRGDIDALRRGKQFVVGTAGRVYDMISKRHLRVDHLRTVVFEDPDALLSGNLKEQCYDILRALPPSIQSCSFSAGWVQQETSETMQSFMRDAVQVVGV